MSDDQMADTHAKLVELAALSLNIDHLDAYIERVRNAPGADGQEHVDLALVAAALQQVAHRLFTVPNASAA